MIFDVIVSKLSPHWQTPPAPFLVPLSAFQKGHVERICYSLNSCRSAAFFFLLLSLFKFHPKLVKQVTPLPIGWIPSNLRSNFLPARQQRFSLCLGWAPAEGGLCMTISQGRNADNRSALPGVAAKSDNQKQVFFFFLVVVGFVFDRSRWGSETNGVNTSTDWEWLIFAVVVFWKEFFKLPVIYISLPYVIWLTVKIQYFTRRCTQNVSELGLKALVPSMAASHSPILPHFHTHWAYHNNGTLAGVLNTFADTLPPCMSAKILVTRDAVLIQPSGDPASSGVPLPWLHHSYLSVIFPGKTVPPLPPSPPSILEQESRDSWWLHLLQLWASSYSGYGVYICTEKPGYMVNIFLHSSFLIGK